MKSITRFRNRTDAGIQLADQLSEKFYEQPLVLALARGGVPVGFEVAKKLRAPLDTVVVRKIGLPHNPEYGIGAIAPGDVLILDVHTIKSLGISKKEVDMAVRKEMEEMERRIVHYQSGKWTAEFVAKTIIVIDDGLATGVTARAALESVRFNYKPSQLIFASPVCAADSIQTLNEFADEVICLLKPDSLVSVGMWYETFDQVTDEEVLACLSAIKKYT